MQLVGRKYTQVNSGYRYGFNGQERDIENGEDMYTALFWEYDSRIGRRWNVDPKPDESQSPYAVFDNNPISITDPNGDCPDCPDKPVQSEYLGWAGLDFGSFGNGIADGLLGASPLGAIKFAADLATDDNARQDFLNGMKSLMTDPIGTLKAVVGDKFESWKNVLGGTGTEQQNYNVGNDIGTLVGTLLTGAGAKAIFEKIKIATFEKKLATTVQKLDEYAVGVNAAEKGKDVHTMVEGIYGRKGRGEKAYVKGKPRDEYRPKGSSNPDVRYSKNPNKPKIVYDIKTGESGMSSKQLNANKSNLPKNTKIKTVMKDANGKYKVTTVGRTG